MKRVIMFFICLCSFSYLMAQRYVVYTMVGKPSLIVKEERRALKLRDQLTPSSVVNIPYDAKLELFDEVNHKQYIIKTPGRASIASLLKDNRNSVVALTDRYFRYILSQVKGNNETIIRSCSDPATVTREEQIDSTVFIKQKE